MAGETMEHPWLSLIETICIAWFTLEYFLRWQGDMESQIFLPLSILMKRFAGAPQKCAFLIDSLNIVDVLSILPFFVSLFFDSGFSSELGGSDKMMMTNSTVPTPAQEKEEGAGSLEDLLQIFRIFKLARSEISICSNSSKSVTFSEFSSWQDTRLGFKLLPTLWSTATRYHGYQLTIVMLSAQELALLVFLMGITSLILGSFCYFIELGYDSGFTSIPTAIYYCVITMTTVGYGDISPTSGEIFITYMKDSLSMKISIKGWENYLGLWSPPPESWFFLCQFQLSPRLHLICFII